MPGLRMRILIAVFFLPFLPQLAMCVTQTTGIAGSITGTVTDPSGAVIPGAKVEISNPVSGYKTAATTDPSGAFHFNNVPFNPYHLSASAPGFQPAQQDVTLRSTVPATLAIVLQVATSAQTVTVEGGAEDLIESDPTAHTDINQSLIEKLPSENANSGLSSVLTNSVPGIVADSNGLFHPLGEHSDTTFSVDNQPISDQQSRAFSNQMSLDSIQSMEVISGVAPAEFGDKLSLVVRTVTRSGLDTPKPTGNFSVGYGSFGTSTGNVNFALGGTKIGNFFSASGLNSGRFLDTAEFEPLHAKGNSEDIFDRFDFQPDQADTLHLNLSLARSWFQTPNTIDQQLSGQDQRQLTRSFNFAPGYTHLFSPSTLLNVTTYLRQDRVGYYPSRNVFSDLPATLAQTRRLTNAGGKLDLSYVQGINNAKAGVQFSHTLLSENFYTGITDPVFNAVCTDANGAAVTSPGITSPSQCAPAGYSANPGFQSGLLPFDLTRGGQLFRFKGHTDIKQEALYLQDSLTLKNVTLMLGLRGDNYNGLSHGSSLQPRLGASYLLKKTGTVLRASYGRIFATPYNENLILSSSTGSGGLATNVFGAFGAQPLTPARRNQFNVGFQQAITKHLVVDAEYFWKYTNGDYDFDVLFNTPLTFPIQWKKSKIDGLAVSVKFPAFHGFSAYSDIGHTRARFFGPEIGGILFNSPVNVTVFRIDHDQALEQTTHFQYQFGAKGPWTTLTWRYDSGVVAGSVPDFATALGLTADQQSQIGLFCGNVFATPFSPLRSCASNLGTTRITIPAPGTENPDRNPPRIAPRNLFDIGAGMDNLFFTDRYKTSLRFTVVNVTNKAALYNFLSTFSGTHFVTPRSYTVELGFHF